MVKGLFVITIVIKVQQCPTPSDHCINDHYSTCRRKDCMFPLTWPPITAILWQLTKWVISYEADEHDVISVGQSFHGDSRDFQPSYTLCKAEVRSLSHSQVFWFHAFFFHYDFHFYCLPAEFNEISASWLLLLLGSFFHCLFALFQGFTTGLLLYSSFPSGAEQEIKGRICTQSTD